MFLLETAPRPDELALAPQWWYARLYTGSAEAADDVIAGILPPLLAEVRTLGSSRWFFIRFIDENGPHLRLRIFGPGHSLDRLVRTMTDLSAHLELIASIQRSGPIELVPGATAAVYGPGGRTIETQPAVYEPELDKYGGLDGVEIAERLFEFSSELALWAVSQHPKGGTRDGIAALLLADTFGALTLGSKPAAHTRRRAWPWHSFWRVHANWWTGVEHVGPGLRDKLEQHAAAHRRAVQARMHAAAEVPDVAAWRRRWFRAVDDYFTAAEQLEVPRTPQHLAFHQNHMLMNRLGYLPREEALLGLHARDWISAPVSTTPPTEGGPPSGHASGYERKSS